jgi:hypothetical protein
MINKIHVPNHQPGYIQRIPKISQLPSGKHTKSYGKSQFLMGKSTINGHFQ